ncbi:DUF2787 family protein [Trichlorobacter lovleyi]|uniref:DUF2787 family protein n=1 Tax=Trichlorobacter lovleyi TaxID=313985 RepID=UPI0024818AA2|nr:DUF2787 family protein [Trichlorobacter lovleyi]
MLKIVGSPAGNAINRDLEDIMNSLVKENGDYIISFKSSDYSAKKGGYRPVEVMIRDSQVIYVTDFTYVGSGPFAELVKGMDWDFAAGECGQTGMYFGLEEAAELWRLYQSNFVDYFKAGKFDDVTVNLL